MTESLEQLGLVSLPMLSMIFSKPTGTSMFIVSFVAGMAFRLGSKRLVNTALNSQRAGTIFNFFVFFFLGLIVPRAWNLFTSDLIDLRYP